MKTKPIFLNTVIFFMVTSCVSLCYAEKIYLKDGKAISGKILSRNKSSVWIKQGSGSIGIALKDIEKIENDDGSISKYDYNTLSNRIRNYIGEKKYNEAVALCSLLLEYFSDDAQIRYLRGMLYQKIGNPKGAKDDYNFLIGHNAADEKILNNLGAIYTQEKNYQEAKVYFAKAIAKNPEMIEAHNNLAELLLQLKDYPQAIEGYNKVIELEPQNTTALYNSGVAYLNSGDAAKAKEQWEKILAFNPQDQEAKQALAYFQAGPDK